MIRAFTVDLAEHMAALRGDARAVALAPALRRRLGIGNATGLGMAPFLVRHPALIDRWIGARDRVARVRALSAATAGSARPSPRPARRPQPGRGLGDERSGAGPRIPVLAADLDHLDAHVGAGALDQPAPWDQLYRWAEATLSIEGQEMMVSLLIEPHGALVDDLAESMAIEEGSCSASMAACLSRISPPA